MNKKKIGYQKLQKVTIHRMNALYKGKPRKHIKKKKIIHLVLMLP